MGKQRRIRPFPGDSREFRDFRDSRDSSREKTLLVTTPFCTPDFTRWRAVKNPWFFFLSKASPQGKAPSRQGNRCLDNTQSNLSGDTFSIEAPENLLRTKRMF